MATTESAAHCSSLAQARDEDRWLAARYADAQTRRRQNALIAFHAELVRAPAVVSEAPLGEIRLQWWREALDELRAGGQPRRHPVVHELAAAGLADPRHRTAIDAMIDAQARLFYAADFQDPADLFDWLRAAEGLADAIAARLLGGDDRAANLAERAGALTALARRRRALAPKFGDAIRGFVEREWADLRAGLSAAPAALSPALAHGALVPLYMRRGAERAFPLRRRMALLGAVAFGRYPPYRSVDP